MILHILEHSILDSLKMLPFLFAAFLIIEAVEQFSSGFLNRALAKFGKAGPVAGALLGCIPQCGFSVVASNLYAGRIITLGTLMAVFLSTSDEAILILLSYPGHTRNIMKILIVKVLIAVAAGFLIDFLVHLDRIHRSFFGKNNENREEHIHEICHGCGCHEHGGILKPALRHTLKIFVYILIFTAILNLIIEVIGIEQLSEYLLSNSVLQPVLAAVIGLIPNCAASVMLTQLYLEGVLSFASIISGLCASAGIGIVVLFKMEHDKKLCFKILGLLLGISIAAGLIISLF